ncbi:MAG: putative WD-40 repeat family protein [Streblomastix strix]|uniref:Putative WD-40 repeat family protein n=1 Tax=Streblomastix strix TaxID=222440 RepID=A0A5J4TKE7_9EUKA|nr:MAG: putative WD-40 repeat family protein [Streblomastix strix]
MIDKCQTWEEAKFYGIGYWLAGMDSKLQQQQQSYSYMTSSSSYQPTQQSSSPDSDKLVQFIEKLAIEKFQQTKDPRDVALYYVALGKKQIVAQLFKRQGDQRKYEFFSQEFKTDASKTKALKNAYVLVGRGEYLFAAAFYVLGCEPSDAVNMCIRMMQDVQLGLVIARLLDKMEMKVKVEVKEKDNERLNGKLVEQQQTGVNQQIQQGSHYIYQSVLEHTLLSHIIPEADKIGDVWMLHLSKLLINQQKEAVKILLFDERVKETPAALHILLHYLHNPLLKKFIPREFFPNDTNYDDDKLNNKENENNVIIIKSNTYFNILPEKG